MAKALAQSIKLRFDETVKAANKTHKTLLTIRDEAMERFQEIEDMSKQKVSAVRELGYEAPGVTYSTVWRTEILDEAKIPREYLMVNHAKIQEQATALKEECRIPGVRVYPRTQVGYGK